MSFVVMRRVGREDKGNTEIADARSLMRLSGLGQEHPLPHRSISVRSTPTSRPDKTG